MKIATLLFVIYWFIVKPLHYHRQENTALIGNTDSEILKYIVMSVPFFYALRDELGIAELFQMFKINDLSALVQL